ncbi:hypothetical protein D9758_018156 [Tetrapyrgos nigripes]|uniref:Nephrocystin 3-like N-terminal domain-containing protein n=1 Tax=Tetrapyrgos nigripes TaxID=182062 RepID=A0A8H5C392_9AGAR|nr:hypothetical protein D9758_018156 [Tetrapyrgos nigripes]
MSSSPFSIEENYCPDYHYHCLTKTRELLILLSLLSRQFLTSLSKPDMFSVSAQHTNQTLAVDETYNVAIASLLEPEMSSSFLSTEQVLRLALHRCKKERIKDVKSTSLSRIIITLKAGFRAIDQSFGHTCAGKSAIAQTLCERFVQRKQLAASFFFSRTNPSRSSAKYLFLTIAYCLATSSGDDRLRAAINDAVLSRPEVLHSSSPTQFEQLIANPLRLISWRRRSRLPTLVVIDGLDKCTGADAQVQVLKTISEGLAVSDVSLPALPLRFLIASRPERSMESQLERSSTTASPPRKISGKSSVMGSEIFVEVVMIRSSRHNGHPKYVGYRDGYPPERLEMVLGLPASDAEAFADLDSLYHQILSSISTRNQPILVLSLVLLTKKRSNLHLLEELFALPPEAVAIVLRGLHAVVNISDDYVVFYHKSFEDFLLDQRRSEQFFVDLDRVCRRMFQLLINVSQGGTLDGCLPSRDLKKRSKTGIV